MTAAVNVLVIEPIRITSSALAGTPGAVSPIVATYTSPLGVPTTATTPPVSAGPYQSDAIWRTFAPRSASLLVVGCRGRGGLARVVSRAAGPREASAVMHTLRVAEVHGPRCSGKWFARRAL